MRPRKTITLNAADLAVIMSGMAIGLIHAAQTSMGVRPKQTHAFLEALANELDVLGNAAGGTPLQDVYVLMSQALMATEPVD